MLTTNPTGLKLRLTIALTALIAALPFILVSAAHAQPVDGNKLVKARALTEHSAWVAGETHHVGLLLDVSRGWHIYWRNPGTGMATGWKLGDGAKGVTLGDAMWPTPERYQTEFSLDFVHEGRVMILVPVTVDESLAGQDELQFALDVSWLVCKDVCVLGEATVTVKVPLVDTPSEAEPTRFAKLFQEARDAAPVVIEGDPSPMGIVATFESAIETIKIGVEGASELRFFPYENPENVSPALPKKELETEGTALAISYAGMGIDLLDEVTGLLEIVKDGETLRYEITIPVKG